MQDRIDAEEAGARGVPSPPLPEDNPGSAIPQECLKLVDRAKSYEQSLQFELALPLRQQALNILVSELSTLLTESHHGHDPEDVDYANRKSTLTATILTVGEDLVKRCSCYGLALLDKGGRDRAFYWLRVAESLTVDQGPLSVDEIIQLRLRAVSLNNLGLFYHRLGNLEASIRHLRMAREAEERLGPDAESPAATLLNLSQVLAAGSQFDQCRDACMEGIHILLHELNTVALPYQRDEAEKLLAHLQMQYAVSLERLHQYPQAADAYNAALDRVRRVFGAGDPKVADLMSRKKRCLELADRTPEFRPRQSVGSDTYSGPRRPSSARPNAPGRKVPTPAYHVVGIADLGASAVKKPAAKPPAAPGLSQPGPQVAKATASSRPGSARPARRTAEECFVPESARAKKQSSGISARVVAENAKGLKDIYLQLSDTHKKAFQNLQKYVSSPTVTLAQKAQEAALAALRHNDSTPNLGGSSLRSNSELAQADQLTPAGTPSASLQRSSDPQQEVEVSLHPAETLSDGAPARNLSSYPEGSEQVGSADDRSKESLLAQLRRAVVVRQPSRPSSAPSAPKLPIRLGRSMTPPDQLGAAPSSSTASAASTSTAVSTPLSNPAQLPRKPTSGDHHGYARPTLALLSVGQSQGGEGSPTKASPKQKEGSQRLRRHPSSNSAAEAKDRSSSSSPEKHSLRSTPGRGSGSATNRQTAFKRNQEIGSPSGASRTGKQSGRDSPRLSSGATGSKRKTTRSIIARVRSPSSPTSDPGQPDSEEQQRRESNAAVTVQNFFKKVLERRKSSSSNGNDGSKTATDESTAHSKLVEELRAKIQKEEERKATEKATMQVLQREKEMEAQRQELLLYLDQNHSPYLQLPALQLAADGAPAEEQPPSQFDILSFVPSVTLPPPPADAETGEASRSGPGQPSRHQLLQRLLDVGSRLDNLQSSIVSRSRETVTYLTKAKEERRQERKAHCNTILRFVRASISERVANQRAAGIRQALLKSYADEQYRNHRATLLQRSFLLYINRTKAAEMEQRRRLALEKKRNAAATVVQQACRSAICSRQTATRGKQQLLRKIALAQATIRGFLARQFTRFLKVEYRERKAIREHNAACTIQTFWRRIFRKKASEVRWREAMKENMSRKPIYSATKIQAAWRMYQVAVKQGLRQSWRKRLSDRRAAEKRRLEADAYLRRCIAAALVLQRAYRCHLARRQRKYRWSRILQGRIDYLIHSTRDHAARTLQRFRRIVAAKSQLRLRRKQYAEIQEILQWRKSMELREEQERMVVARQVQMMCLIQSAGRGFAVRRLYRRKRVEQVAAWDQLCREVAEQLEREKQEKLERELEIARKAAEVEPATAPSKVEPSSERVLPQATTEPAPLPPVTTSDPVTPPRTENSAPFTQSGASKESPEVADEHLVTAIVQIQAMARGHLCRRHSAPVLEEKNRQRQLQHLEIRRHDAALTLTRAFRSHSAIRRAKQEVQWRYRATELDDRREEMEEAELFASQQETTIPVTETVRDDAQVEDGEAGSIDH
jgi:hypothetical protein